MLSWIAREYEPTTRGQLSYPRSVEIDGERAEARITEPVSLCTHSDRPALFHHRNPRESTFRRHSRTGPSHRAFAAALSDAEPDDGPSPLPRRLAIRTEGEFLAWIEDRTARFESFVNEDVSSLLGVAALLVQRYCESGFTDSELADPRSQEIILWAVERGKSSVYQHMAVSLWAALEAYLEDLWVEAAQRVSIDGASPLAKVKASIIELQGLTESERYRKLWHDAPTEKVYGVDRYRKVFDLIAITISVESILARGQDVPRTAAGVPATDEWVRATLHELREVRNVIVHRGGLIDERLATVSGGRLRAGEELEIEDESHVNYGIAVHTCAGAALSAVADRLNLALVYES